MPGGGAVARLDCNGRAQALAGAEDFPPLPLETLASALYKIRDTGTKQRFGIREHCEHEKASILTSATHSYDKNSPRLLTSFCRHDAVVVVLRTAIVFKFTDIYEKDSVCY
jgi:hypothetical protein